MNIKIHSIHFDIDIKLKEYITEKLHKIEKFSNKVIDAEIFLKLDHLKGNLKDKIAEIKISVPGKILFAEERSKNFEESIELSMDSIIKQLKKHKERIQQ